MRNRYAIEDLRNHVVFLLTIAVVALMVVSITCILIGARLRRSGIAADFALLMVLAVVFRNVFTGAGRGCDLMPACFTLIAVITVTIGCRCRVHNAISLPYTLTITALALVLIVSHKFPIAEGTILISGFAFADLALLIVCGIRRGPVSVGALLRRAVAVADAAGLVMGVVVLVVGIGGAVFAVFLCRFIFAVGAFLPMLVVLGRVFQAVGCVGGFVITALALLPVIGTIVFIFKLVSHMLGRNQANLACLPVAGGIVENALVGAVSLICIAAVFAGAGVVSIRG